MTFEPFALVGAQVRLEPLSLSCLDGLVAADFTPGDSYRDSILARWPELTLRGGRS
ncbi:MAG: hypothetical protein ACP5E2_12785 [Terracidiphilus sp.]